MRSPLMSATANPLAAPVPAVIVPGVRKPVPKASRFRTTSEPAEFTAMRSVRLSSVTSAAAKATMLSRPVEYDLAPSALSAPVLLPGTTKTVPPVPVVAAAESVLPSRLKSPVIRPVAGAPTWTGAPAMKVPSPLPRAVWMVPEALLRPTRSDLPSPLRSAGSMWSSPRVGSTGFNGMVLEIRSGLVCGRPETPGLAV